MAAISVSFEGVAVLVARGLAKLESVLTPDSFAGFLRQSAGVNVADGALGGTITGALGGAASAAGSLNGLADAVENASGDVALIAAGVQLVQGITTTFIALGNVSGAFGDISGLDATSAQRLSSLSADFSAFLTRTAFMTFLDTKFRTFSQFLSLVGLMNQERVQGPSGTFDFEQRDLDLGRLSRLLSDPKGLFHDELGWGATLTFEPGNALFDRLEAFLRHAGFGPLRIREPDGSLSLEFPRGTLKRLASDPTGLEYELGLHIAGGVNVSGQLQPGVQVHASTTGEWAPGLKLELRAPLSLTAVPASGAFASTVSFGVTLSPTTASTFRLLGVTGGSFVEAQSVTFAFDLSAAGGRAADPGFTMTLNGAHTVIAVGAGDGFIQGLFGGGNVEASFDLGVHYAFGSGVSVEAGGLSFVIPLHVSIGGVDIDGFRVALPIGAARPGIPIDFSTTIAAALGPFKITVDRIGLATDLLFDSPNPRLGIADFSAKFLPPTGLGVSLDGPGGISGGGFLSFDSDLGRYSGAIELKVFSIGVKAFGVLDTKFPDGRLGYSFAILIAAEFTPIQVGFGFTLNGVGGLLAINRSLVSEALGNAVRSGSVDHLLFPSDPVRDAPAILNDIETIFPATPDHFVMGPMAKLGWGTPTLITAELGIVIEIPGPRIAVVGIAETALPTRQISLIRINLAIVGILDFPKRLFSLDASLFDSIVGGFPVAGDAAFRMSFGDQPNFALSVGGFNPAFKAPPNFPKLRRVSVDLGVNGNPSLTLSGYFALTSNTAQLGAAIALRASGAGIVLEGHVSFDAMFVFSPFSFEADLDAGMSVKFHGIGIGIHFHGHLSGPSPFHVSGDVCVSILFWDACLGVSATFGKSRRATLPTIDPWDAFGVDAQLAIIGLQQAMTDQRNWSGAAPPSALTAVSLADHADAVPPLDPVGSATVRQKVVPLRQKITKFGVFKPVKHDQFTLAEVAIGTTVIDLHDVTPVTDDFARDTFKDLKAAEKLSAPPYDRMEAGFTLKPDVLHIGATNSQSIGFETVLLDGNRTEVANDNSFTLTVRHLQAMLLRSASGLGGLRRTGVLKYGTPGAAAKVQLPGEAFVVADACAFTRNTAITVAPTTHVQASLALEQHLADFPEDSGRFAVVPSYELP